MEKLNFNRLHDYIGLSEIEEVALPIWSPLIFAIQLIRCSMLIMIPVVMITPVSRLINGIYKLQTYCMTAFDFSHPVQLLSGLLLEGEPGSATMVSGRPVHFHDGDRRNRINRTCSRHNFHRGLIKTAILAKYIFRYCLLLKHPGE
jgi:hypothetical protein